MDDEIIIGVNTQKKNKGASRKKLASKKKNKNFHKIKLFLKCTTCVAITIGILVFLMISPIFNIETIEVEGNNLLSKEKIISLSEIELGENIFRINIGDIKNKIKSNAYVGDVQIKRKFLNSVNITINERTIKYMIEYADGYVYINNQGYMMDISTERKNVPIIVGYSIENNKMQVGNRLDIEELKKFDIVNKIMQVSNSVGIDNLITKIDISNEDNYTLILESEMKTVYLGNCSDLTTRISTLKAIVEKNQGKEGEIFINGNTVNDYPRFKEKVF